MAKKPKASPAPLRLTRTTKSARVRPDGAKVERTTRTQEVICTGDGAFCRELRRKLGRAVKLLLEPL